MAAHNLAPPKMPEQYKHPTNDPILERRHPKIFAEGNEKFNILSQVSGKGDFVRKNKKKSNSANLGVSL